MSHGLLYLPRRGFSRWFLPALVAGVCNCHGQTEPSVFTALGVEPAKLGQAWVQQPPRAGPSFTYWYYNTEPDPFGLVVLPSTPAERQQLLAAMLVKPLALAAAQRLFVAQLLEGWGRLDEALALVELPGAPTIDPLHMVRLRYRKGDLDGAAATFAGAAQDPARPEGIGYQALRQRSEALVRPFVALAQYPELAKFLEWLQDQCRSTALRGEILALRLNVAWQLGTSARLLDQLQRESPILRQAAEWLLTLDPTKLPPRLELLKWDDLVLLQRLARDVPAVTAAIRERVAGAAGSPDQRAELFLQLTETSGADVQEVVKTWLARDENILPVLAAALPTLISQGSSRLPEEALAALADRHPDALPTNLLAGLTLRRNRPVRPTTEPMSDPATRFFQRATQAELIEATAGEGLNPGFFLPQVPVDIAGMAVDAQAGLLDPQTLLELLTHHPGFNDLPARERARYFALAKLDVPFMDALLTLDWTDPANDRCGDWLGRYLASIPERNPPADARWERLVAAMPAMLAGSKNKDESRVFQDTVQLRGELARRDPAGTTFAAVLPALRERLEGSARVMAASLTATQQPEPSVYRPDATRSPDGKADPLRCLNWFTPARLIRWVDEALPGEILSGVMGRNGNPTRSLGLLAARFPVLADRQQLYFPMAPQDLEVFWKLRRLLPADSPHAIAGDLGIALYRLPKPPEDLMAAATRHLASLLEKPPDLDFILFKLFAPAPIGQAGPDGRPGPTADWSGFAPLTTAPACVRRQAAAVLEMNTSRAVPVPRFTTLLQQLRQGIMTPARTNPAQDADDAAYNDLQRQRQLGQQAGPAARATATKVLRDFVASGARTTSPTENIAIGNLVQTGGFDAFLKEIAAQYRAQPGGELTLAKAMHALHQYTIVHSHGESLVFAKQVLALDPDDLPAALEGAGAAITENDRAGLFAALPALRKGYPMALLAMISTDKALALLRREDASRLLEIIALPVPLTPAKDPTIGRGTYVVEPQRLAALNQYFDDASPQLGTRFRQLIPASGWFAPPVLIPALVAGLVRGERQSEAASLLAGIITGAGQAPPRGAGLRFPAAPVPLFQLSPNHLAAFSCAVSAKLCREVLEQLAATPTAAVSADLLAALRYAAAPSDEVFTAAVLPMLATLRARERAEAIRPMIALLKDVPGAEARQKLLDKASFAADPQPRDYFEIVRQASRCLAPEDQADLRTRWQLLRKLTPGPGIRSDYTLFPLFEAMVTVADEPLWADYSAELLETLPQTMNPIVIARLLPGLDRPSLQPRLSPVLRVLVPTIFKRAFNLESLSAAVARAAWYFDDSATLQLLAGKCRDLPDQQLTPRLKQTLADLRLVAGDPEAALPLLWARPGPGDQWTILWSMAGVQTEVKTSPTALACDPKVLDGGFDLTILAAPDSTRFKQLTTLAGAKASGSIVLTLPEGTTTLSLTATQPATKAVLRTAPLELSLTKLPALELAAPPPGKSDVRKLPSPFGSAEPVIALGLNPGDSVKLAALPWQPGQSLTVSAWVLGCGGAQLAVQSLDRDGKPLGANPLFGSGDNESLPRWRNARFTLELRDAMAADQLILTAACPPRSPTSTSRTASPMLWVTDVRLETVPESPPPAGAQRIGRIRGEISALSCDPAGEWLAAALKDGRVSVLETRTGHVRDFEPCPGTGFFFIGVGGQRVIAVDSNRMVHALDLNTGVTRQLGRLDFPQVNAMKPSLALSPDGEWLAWPGMMVDVLVARLGPETIGKPLSLPVGGSPELTLDSGDNAILACGSRQNFRVPITDLPTLDLAKLTALAAPPQPKSACQHHSRDDCSWLDPIHSLRLRGHSGELAFEHTFRT